LRYPSLTDAWCSLSLLSTTRTGNTYIESIPVAERAAMAKAAVGTSGSCADYVRSIHQKLQSLGIADGDVETFLTLMES